MAIHATAIVAEGAQVASSAEIGPYCIVGEHVRIGANARLVGHVSVDGHTTIGDRTVIYPFASIGQPPQDLKYRGEPSTLSIGADCQIREHVTVNPGTEGGGMRTVIGDRCLLMVGAHVAHDCILGDHVIMANNATLAGHVIVGEHVLIGGLSAVLQFVRIGKHAVIGGMSGVDADVLPYARVVGERAFLDGLNLVGLKRRGFSRDAMRALTRAFEEIFGGGGTFAERLAALDDAAVEPVVRDVIAFLREETARERPLCRPRTPTAFAEAA